MEVDEADYVEAVVLEGRLQKISRAGAQVVEIRVRHQRAGQRIVSLIAKDSFLDHPQGAAFEAMAVQRQHQREQVDMGRVAEFARHARHDPSCAEHGQVE